MTNLGRYFKLGFPGNIYLHALKRLPPLIKLMLTVDGEPNITLTRECRPYRIIRISIRPWLTTGTRARNIQYLDAILFDKITELVGGQLCSEHLCINQCIGFTLGNAELNGQLGAASGLAKIDDGRAITINHIALGSLPISSSGEFDDRVA
jgi:hypothetical protein